MDEHNVWCDQHGGWWHRTEDEDQIGPFSSRHEAEAALKKYAQSLEEPL